MPPQETPIKDDIVLEILKDIIMLTVAEMQRAVKKLEEDVKGVQQCMIKITKIFVQICNASFESSDTKKCLIKMLLTQPKSDVNIMIQPTYSRKLLVQMSVFPSLDMNLFLCYNFQPNIGPISNWKFHVYMCLFSMAL